MGRRVDAVGAEGSRSSCVVAVVGRCPRERREGRRHVYRRGFTSGPIERFASSTVSGHGRRVLTAMRNRYFFPAVIGAILLVLAIMAVILLVLGDNQDQGEDTGPDPSPPVRAVAGHAARACMSRLARTATSTRRPAHSACGAAAALDQSLRWRGEIPPCRVRVGGRSCGHFGHMGDGPCRGWAFGRLDGIPASPIRGRFDFQFLSNAPRTGPKGPDCSRVGS